MELGRWSSYRKGKKSDDLSIVSANWKPDLSHDTCQNLVKTVFALQEKSWHEATRRQSDQTNPETWNRQDGMNVMYIACNLLESYRSYYFGTHGWWGEEGQGDRVRLGDTRWPGAEWRARENMRCRITGIKEWSWRRRRKKRMKQRLLISYFHWAIKVNEFFWRVGVSVIITVTCMLLLDSGASLLSDTPPAIVMSDQSCRLCYEFC